MSELKDITVNLPAEYFGALSEVIRTGLKHANIDPRIRQELRDWWTAEKEFIEIENNES